MSTLVTLEDVIANSHRPGALGMLFRMHGTDKDHNGYTGFYEGLLSPMRSQKFTLLEIGIGTVVPGAHSSMHGWTELHADYRPGASLRAWRDYLPLAAIVGLDPQPDTQFEAPRISTVLADSTDASSVEKALAPVLLGKPPLKVVVEDGSHTEKDQLDTLSVLWPFMDKSGVYIIEDVQLDVEMTAFLRDAGERASDASVLAISCPRSSLVVLTKR